VISGWMNRLFLARLARLLWELAKGTPESGQHLPSVGVPVAPTSQGRQDFEFWRDFLDAFGERFLNKMSAFGEVVNRFSAPGADTMRTTGANQLIRLLRHAVLRQNGAGLTDSQLLELYVTQRDEAAFDALIRRHGSMVLGVCRRILRNQADAEDAFQATFLVFVRKAASIRSRSTVSNWLYGVAHKTALKAKAMDRRRHVKEREAGTVPRDEARAEVWQELQTLLDAELSSLPEKYSAPIVLCDLEGKTIKAAARILGWPPGTVATRLTRGRARLARQLTKHGLTLSGGVIAASLAQASVLGNPPSALLASTTKAASLFAATGQYMAAGVVSAKVAALTDGVMKTMLLVKLRLGVSLLLVLAFIGVSTGVYRAQAMKPAQGDAKTVAIPVRNNKTMDTTLDDREMQKEWDLPRFDEIFVSGRVKVIVTPSSEQHVTVHGNRELVRCLEPHVVKKSKYDRLVLDLSSQADKTNMGTNTIEVRITVPRLSSVIAEGRAAVELRGIENESLTVTVSDIAKLEVAGTSKKLLAIVHDSGHLDASRLAAGDVTVTASGKSSSVFRPEKSFNVISSGESRLEYIGTPAQLHKVTSDRSTIVRR
jgi:RNA polymerase sigma factor (sigma-70 family)